MAWQEDELAKARPEHVFGCTVVLPLLTISESNFGSGGGMMSSDYS
jgi:hypothetical protein